MSAETLVRLMDMTAGALADADMPTDPFEATDLLDGVRHLAAELVGFAAQVRAHRLAMAPEWAAYEAARASLDKTGQMPPPPPEPEPDPPPEPEPQPEPPTDTAATGPGCSPRIPGPTDGSEQ